MNLSEKMGTTIDDRLRAVETSITWYKGAFWSASIVSGLLIAAASTVVGIAWQSLLKASSEIASARDDALAEISASKGAIACDIRDTLWVYSFNYPQSDQFPSRPQRSASRHMIDIPFTYLATSSERSPDNEFYFFKQSEYIHENERYWRYIPVTRDNNVEAMETISLDGTTKRLLKRVGVAGFIFQTEILNPSADVSDRHRLRMRLVSPDGCAQLVLGA